MSRNLGDAYISILPSTDNFRRLAKTAIEKALTGVEGDAGLGINDKGLGTKVRAAVEKATREAGTINAKVDANTSGVRKATQEIMAAQARISKAREQDANAEMSQRDAVTRMYSKMFDNIDKRQAAQAKADAKETSDRLRQEDSVSRAQDKAWSSYGKNLLATQRMEEQRAKARIAQEKAFASYSDNIKVGLDSKQAESKAEELRTKLDHIFANRINQDVGVNDQGAETKAASLRSKLTSLFNRKINQDIGLNEGETLTGAAALRAKLDALFGKDIKQGVDLSDGGVKARAAGLRAELGAIFGKDIKQGVDIDRHRLLSGAASAFSSVASISKKAGGDAGSSFSSSLMNSLGKVFNRKTGIAGLIVAGLAALPAAVGVVGAAIGVGLGAAIIASATATLIKDQDKLTKLLATIRKKTGDPNAGLDRGTPAQQVQGEALQKQIKTLQLFQATANRARSVWEQLKTSMFSAVADSGFLKAANSALSSFQKSLTTLQPLFTSLFAAAAPLIQPMVDMFVLLVQNLLPGLTKLLSSAGGQIGVILQQLGSDVGFQLGRWFASAAPYMEVSGKYLHILAGAIGSVVDWIIRFGGEAAKAFDGSAWKGFGATIKPLADTLLKLIVPAFQAWSSVMAPVAATIVKIVTPLLQFLANNPGLVKAITITFLAFKAFGVLSAIMSGLAGAMRLVGVAIDIVRAAILLLEASNPIGWIALVGAAMATAAILIITHWSAFLAFMKKFWPILLSIMLPGLGLIIALVVKNWSHIAAVTVSVWNGIKTVLSAVWNWIKGAASAVWGFLNAVIPAAWNNIKSNSLAVWNGIKGALSAVWNWIKSAATSVWGFLKSAIPAAWNAVKGATLAVWNGIKGALSATWNWIKGAASAVWGAVRNVVVGGWNAIKGATIAVWNAVKGVLSTVWNWAKAAASAVWGAMRNTIVTVWNIIKSATIAVWNAIKGALSTVWNWAKAAASAVWSAMRNTIVTVWNIIKGATIAVWNAIKGALSTVWNWAKAAASAVWSAMRNTIVTVWNIIKGATIAVWNAIKGALSTVWNWAKAAAGAVWSAMRNIIVTVWNIIKGATIAVWNAIKGALSTVWNWIKGAASTIWNALRNIITTIWNAIKNVTASVWNGIKSVLAGVWNWIKGAASKIWNDMKNIISGVWNKIKEVTGSIWNGIKGTLSGIWGGIKSGAKTAVDWIHDTVVGVWQKLQTKSAAIWKGIGNGLSAGVNAGKHALANSVNFVTQDIINPVIRGYNAANDIWSGGDIAQIPRIKFAKGGQVPGYAPGSDTVPAMLSPGEFIMNPVAAKAIGYKNLHEMNKSGPGRAPRMTDGNAEKFAEGGQVSIAAYRNPLPNPTKLTPTRIDQGVDFQGAGPMAALGAGRILNTSGGGWPGGPYMSMKLGEGPLAGMSVYYAENIKPIVKAGQNVKAGQHIANWFDGGTGIELGFDDGSGSRPLSQTKEAGSISGRNLPGGGTRGTKVGKLFDDLLVALGLPKAPNYDLPTGGSLPGNLDKKGGKKGGLVSQLAALAKAAPGGGGGGSIDPKLQKAYDALIKRLDYNIKNYGGKTIGGLLKGIAGTVLKAGRTIAKGAEATAKGKQYTAMGGHVSSLIKPAIQSKYDAAVAALDTGGGDAPPGGATAGSMANGTQLYNYLLAHVFHGKKIAAAGATASIWGECVTLDHMILTKRGWLKHNEVAVGDETMGYNPKTGKSEWTTVTRVMHYDNSPVVTHGNQYWNATFTPNHRWLTEAVGDENDAYADITQCPKCEHKASDGQNGYRGLKVHMAKRHGILGPNAHKAGSREQVGPAVLKEFSEFTPNDRIVLSKEAETGTSLPITDREAALLGWIAGDGSVSYANRTISVCVFQSKTEHFVSIEDCLPDIGGIGHYTKPASDNVTEQHTWRLPASYARDLIDRAGNPKNDSFEQVLAMSSSQRKSWLAAVIAAEGTVSGTSTVIYQNEGSIAEAIELAVYLEGYRPSHNRVRESEVSIGLRAPVVGGYKRRSFTKDAGTASVWCVATELGSWTSRNESGIFLTGNSMWNPMAQGTGGRGLIGWTPPGSISDEKFKGGMRTQLPAIVEFIAKNNDWGRIGVVQRSKTVEEAANAWGHLIERFGISDVHGPGIAAAKKIAGLANGGYIPGFAPGHDSVPAMLSPGEFVMNPRAVRAIGVDNLHSMNNSNPAHGGSHKSIGLPGYYANGGLVSKAVNSVHKAAPMTAAQIAAAKREGAAKQSQAAADAKETRILNLGIMRSHNWLLAKAKHYLEKMAAAAGRGDARSYAGTSLAYYEVQAALTRWPDQLHARHDKYADMQKAAQAKADAARKSGNNYDYMIWNQKALADAGLVSSVNAKMAAAADPATKPIDTKTLNPVEKLAYWLGNTGAKLWTALSNQLRNHSLNPQATGKLSKADMSSLALNVTPSVLDVLYGGPGASGANWQSLSSALSGDLFTRTGISGAGSGPALSLLGKLSGIHGIYSGKRFAQGGLLPAGPGIGFGADGIPFSFNEGGRRERIVPENQVHDGPQHMTEATGRELVKAVKTLADVTAYYGKQTSDGISGAGKFMTR